MNHFHSFSLRYLGKIFLSLLLLLPLSCKDPLQEELTVGDPDFQGVEQWQDLLEDLIFEKSTIVQQKASIQDAINAATPGEAIYIEPGVYKETLIIDKADVKLIGLDGANGEKVILVNPGGEEVGIHVNKQIAGVEVRNIKFQNFSDNSLNISSPTSEQVGRHNPYFNMSREQVGSNIAHYQFEVRLDDGEFDVVRIHRVVREYRPYRPNRTKGEVFMIHGASQDFDDIFFTAGAVNNIKPETSSPVYLASKGIDVWGIDLGWTLVPLETTDFTFMKDWGVERDVDHTLAAMSLARLIRGLTGQGFGGLNLLGFSYGATVAYAAAGRETQQHAILRDIKGIIPVDQAMKYNLPSGEAFRSAACAQAQAALDSIAKGKYQNNGGIGTILLGNLAANAPDDLSPIIPGFTNYQAPIFLGANIYLTPNAPPVPYWHFVAGNGEKETNIATDLQYTDPNRWIALFRSAAPYQPYRTNYDVTSCFCDEEDVSIDDYLDQIEIPIYYLGAGGGTGTYGEYTASEKTASTDVTINIVSLLEEVCEDQRFRDFGHADLFMADNAPIEVWEDLRLWLVNHHSSYLQ